MKWLFYSDTYMPLLTAIVFLCRWKVIDKKERIILVYTLYNFILFGYSNILAVKSINNLFLYHINTLLEFSLLTWYITRQKLNLRAGWVLLVIAAYAVLWVLNILFLEPLSMFNSNSVTVACFLLLLQSMYYMLDLSTRDEILYFHRLPAFWIISGVLVSCAISTLTMMAYKVYVEDRGEAEKIWIIAAASIIIKFVPVIVGLLCFQRSFQHTQPPPSL